MPFNCLLRLDEHIEVQQADYENGLLVIELETNHTEERETSKKKNW